LILQAISENNDTLGDLGCLDDSTFMGVRIREELRQAIKLNNSSGDNKRAHLKEQVANTRTTNFDPSRELDGGQRGDGEHKISTSTQAEYPLLKPITFTNIITDDYLDSGVWALK